jgi:tetratricopeptide (TPR) repeat protein
VHLRQGATELAIATLERALAVWETADLPPVFLEISGPLASAYADAGRAAEAIALLERGIALALTLRHRMGNVLRSGGMAEAYLAAGRIDEALPLAELFVELARMVDGRGHVASGLRLIADAATHAEPPKADVAEAALARCLALAQELDMRPLEARALLTQSALFRRLGRAAEAASAHAEAKRRFVALGMVSRLRW